MKQLNPKKSLEYKFNCMLCNYSTNCKKDYQKHLLTKKHKLNSGETVKIPKKFVCAICGLNFKSKTTLWRHKKKCEQPKINNVVCPKVSKSVQNVSDKFFCICGKNYKTRSGLSKHKKKCNFTNNEKIEEKNGIIPSNNVEYLLKEILEENKILREKIANLEIGNTYNNQTNNNHFNINMFLNEKCKNAMNLEDFVEKIKFTLEDLNYTKDNGYAKGISNIFIKNLNDMDVTERPIHCSDQKRMQFYVKDANEWTKDSNNEKLDNTIAKVSKKQIQNLEKWVKENPDYLDSDVKIQEYYKLVRNLSQPNDDKNLRSIKKKVGENIKIEK